MIEFAVAGKPITQGSKVAMVNRHTGRPFLRDDSSPGSSSWREAIAHEARLLQDFHGKLEGPLVLELVFVMHRPKSAPKGRPYHCTTRPDVLKLARAVEDSLTHVLYADDAQIVREVLEKVPSDNGWTGVRIRLGRHSRDSTGATE